MTMRICTKGVECFPISLHRYITYSRSHPWCVMILGVVKLFFCPTQDANQQLAFTLDDDAGGLFAISPIATCTFVSIMA